MLSFLPGQKVFLHFEKEWVTILSLQDPFLEVKDPSGVSFLVDAEDVWTEEEYHFEAIEKPKQTKLPVTSRDQIAISVLESGLYLLLRPSDDSPIAEEYQCWLLNSAPFLCSVYASLNTLDTEPFDEELLLDQFLPVMFCEVYKADIGSQSRIDFKINYEIPGKSNSEHLLRFKLLPKKIIETSSQTLEDGSSYKIFQLLTMAEISAKETPGWSLSSNQKQKKTNRLSNHFPIIDLQAKAAFPLELDLHIDKIVPSWKSLKQNEIANKQIQIFEQYIQNALRFGVDKVFIIHGIGEGKLKERIHQSLDRMDYVRSFKNEFHPKYGWGATEIEF